MRQAAGLLRRSGAATHRGAAAACATATAAAAGCEAAAALGAAPQLQQPWLSHLHAEQTRPLHRSTACQGGPTRLPAVPVAETAGGGPVQRVQLVRDFIHDSLYHPTEGYFSKRTATGAGVVGSLPRPLDFNAFQGQTEYLLAVQALYKQLQTSWLTPVEIFQPHYGRALAACILHRWHEQAADAVAAGRPEPPLLVHEIGGGTGTLARNILDWLREEHPAAYRRCHYSCIEISPVLAALQRRKVAAEGGHAARFSVRQHDAADPAGWRAEDAAAASGGGAAGGVGEAHAFIVLCEVLDNLPHDRVWRDMGSSEWHETLVAQGDWNEDLTDWHAHHAHGGQGDFFEVLQPVADPLIRRCLQAVEAAEGDSGGGGKLKSGVALAAARAWRRLVGEATAEVRWLPTGCLRLLDTLHQARPSHTLIAADFDELPEVAVAGVGAPLVATTVGGSTFDHGSYLVPRGTADIFFSTDFALLGALYRQAAQRAQRAQHASSGSSSEGATRSDSATSGSHAGGAAGSTPAVRAEALGTADFMARYSPDLAATRTASGYNPLLEDYSNSAFFLGSCLWQRAFFVGGSAA